MSHKLDKQNTKAYRIMIQLLLPKNKKQTITKKQEQQRKKDMEKEKSKEQLESTNY